MVIFSQASFINSGYEVFTKRKLLIFSGNVDTWHNLQFNNLVLVNSIFDSFLLITSFFQGPLVTKLYLYKTKLKNYIRSFISNFKSVTAVKPSPFINSNISV